MTRERSWVGAVIDRPVSVSIAALVLVFLGLVSLWHLPVSLLPSLERPRLRVELRQPDLGRQEILEQVVRPLERRLASLPGVLDVVATVDDGAASVVAETEWQTDVDRLRIDAERRLGDVLGGRDATLSVESGDARPIVRLAVLGADAAERTEAAEQVLLPELARLPGAGEIRLWGTARRHPVVRPRAADLAARGLTAADIEARLESVGRDQPLGTVRRGGVLRPLVLRRPVTSVDALAALRIELPPSRDSTDGAGTDGRWARLDEVADVGLETVADGSVARVDGEEAVLLELHRAPEANAVLLARGARGVVEELGARGDPRLRIEIVDDASREVMGALLSLLQAAGIGLLLGTLVLRWLLGRWRPTVALLVVVPASLLSAFAAFYLAGLSLDLVSLAGLALAAGMLVDNSVVVVEAIATARERGAARPVEEGTRQIAMALVAGFVTTAVVFVPLIYLRGLARAFFGVQAFALVSTLALSLVFSLSLTPVLSRRLRRRRDEPAAGRQPGREAYLRLLRAALRRPGVALLVSFVFLGAVATLVPRLPRTLVPPSQGSGVHADLRFPAGVLPEEAGQRLASLESASPAPSVALYRGAEGAGGGADGAGRSGGLGGDTVLGEAGTAEIDWLVRQDLDGGERELRASDIRRRLPRLPGVEAEVRPRRDLVSAAVEQAGRDLGVEVSATTPERARALAERVRAHLASAGLEARIGGGIGASRPAWRVRWRPGTAPQADGLATQLRAGLGEVERGRTEIAGVQPAIRLAATAPAELGLLPVRPPATEGREVGIVPLGALAEIGRELRPPPDGRRNGRPTVLLELAPTTDADLEDLERILAALPRSLDEQVELGAGARELRRAFSQLRLALGLALVLVFLTVAALYESLALPLAVMATVPTAGAGAVLALVVTGGQLDVMSFLGMILLAGVVVNNAIVLIHRVEQLRRGRGNDRDEDQAGVGLGEALEAAAAERYRPILITTLTTFLGMLPLALVGGAAVELRRSLAVAVCGGLLTAWAGALLVVPVIYRLLRRR